MTTNRWIENSRNVYVRLLSLYPKEHRGNYGTAMQQVFTDQCRSAYKQMGAFGIILLWLRIIPDLGQTALLEHISSPRAAWGLMEPVPNEPLPWKGIFLILLPGLVYLVSQIAQLTGQPWYMTVYYRAAFLLILPVLAVWAITRRFPIWGLIPLGLLYRLVQETGYNLVLLDPYVFSRNPFLNSILIVARMVKKEFLIPVAILSTVILLLAWRYIRQQKPTRSFWIWLGIYLVVASIQITDTVGRTILFAQHNAESTVPFPGTLLDFLHDAVGRDLYNFSALLLLIFIGSLFTRKHGFFAILIPMGYIIPTIIFTEQYNFDQAANPTAALIVVGASVLAYRLLLTMIAPIWISRTSSQIDKKRVVLISIAFALGIQFVMQASLYLGLFDPQNFTMLEWIELFRNVVLRYVVLPEATIISAMILGVVMYQNSLTVYNPPAHPVVAYPAELSPKKAIE
jgi:hypothetical protein